MTPKQILVETKPVDSMFDAFQRIAYNTACITLRACASLPGARMRVRQCAFLYNLIVVPNLKTED